MKIVIDIPEEQHKRICDHTDGVYDMVSLLTIIENGTPLPKGHGRLIDADKLLEKQYRIDDSATLSTRDVVDVEDVDDTPAIIEADMKGDE